MIKLCLYLVFLLNISLSNALYSYTKDVICVLPFTIDEYLVEEYELELGITNNRSNQDIENIVNIEPENAINNQTSNIEETEIFDDENIILTEEEVATTDKNVTDKYSVAHGIARLLVEELNASKMVFAVNYDIIIALLNEANMDVPYRTFAKDIDTVGELFEDVFAAKYLIYGEVKKFNAQLNKNETAETAEVSLTINLKNLQTDEIITLNISRENIEHEYRGEKYLAHDAYFLESALGKASQSVLQEVVTTLISKIETPPLEATIIRLGKTYNTFYINVGKNMGVTVNDIFDIYQTTFLFAGTNNSQYQSIMSNIGTYSIQGNSSNGYLENRTETITNKIDEVRYTSDMFADYLRSISINEYIGKARVTKTYENFSEMIIEIATNFVTNIINTTNISNDINTTAVGNSYTNENNDTTNYQINNPEEYANYTRVEEVHSTNFIPTLLMKAIKTK